VTKDDIGILPKRYTEWVFDLGAEQKRLIKTIKKDLLAELDSGASVEVLTSSAAFNKLQQVANGFLIDSESGELHRLMDVRNNPRALAMLDWLSAGEGKAIIWARFKEDMRICAEALEAAGVNFVEYHGGTKDVDRKANVESFMSPTGAQVFLANPQSAGTGLNLQGLCNRALYYSNSFNAIDRWQSEDRIHRMGTKGICTFTDLLGVGSTDRYIRNNLRKKEGIGAMSLDELKTALDTI
jgi:SNF2 family DNA or RNA helicase